jgi:intraflagellar transport protein 88
MFEKAILYFERASQI